MHQHNRGHTGRQNRKGLLISFILTATIMVVEFVGGMITNSLALISDAGHMLSDAGALLLSLLAVSYAARPPSPSKTFGFYRFEILAALLNGATLFLIAGIIMWEAYHRIWQPPAVQSGTMVIIAAIGLLTNLTSAWALTHHGDTGNVNVRSAYLHILGDALGSVGAITAGALIYFFQWNWADPLVSVVVGLLILRSAWHVMEEALRVLMEGTPPTIDWEDVKGTLMKIPNVKDVHDLHIWSLTSGVDSLTCHLLVEPGKDPQQILKTSVKIIAEKFQIEHTTIQVETEDFNHGVCSASACMLSRSRM
ncbi:cation diffusion facilitator family transporter [Anaeroselena agilis]|uniref:Cation diffusion facilitator family transporter n=1 Tax=Anaeroselena agilis TaxID=3063788 RepID=A0ABU3NX82_9FIRM|nr:cation diffusion facilitator family transporter [Selenomonadales bacterium 4137-cl]